MVRKEFAFPTYGTIIDYIFLVLNTYALFFVFTYNWDFQIFDIENCKKI